MSETTLGQCLCQVKPEVQIRPTDVLYLLLGKHDWMSTEQARKLIIKSEGIDLDWDAYVVSDGQAEPQGIYLFGPGGQAHRAFEVRVED